MQYWVDVERLKYFMDFRGMTIADVEAECHTRTRHELFMKLMTEGGADTGILFARGYCAINRYSFI